LRRGGASAASAKISIVTNVNQSDVHNQLNQSSVATTAVAVAQRGVAMTPSVAAQDARDTLHRVDAAPRRRASRRRAEE
jgi:hypothetical protein